MALECAPPRPEVKTATIKPPLSRKGQLRCHRTRRTRSPAGGTWSGGRCEGQGQVQPSTSGTGALLQPSLFHEKLYPRHLLRFTVMHTVFPSNVKTVSFMSQSSFMIRCACGALHSHTYRISLADIVPSFCSHRQASRRVVHRGGVSDTPPTGTAPSGRACQVGQLSFVIGAPRLREPRHSRHPRRRARRFH